MEKRKLLIATTNKGKLKEIKSFLEDLPFEFLSLDDLDEQIPEPEETEMTVEGNAILKAKYYGKKTGLLTLADDGGLFIDALDGWPGVKSARVDKTGFDRRYEKVLEEMKDIKGEKKRKASFRVAMIVYSPKNDHYFISEGELEGKILESATEGGENNWGFNNIFFVNELKKTYGEMTLQEKNSISHRGKALIKIKYYLQNQYRGKHYAVPVAIIVKNGKVLMNKRNDPHNPEFHEVWEFPGGAVELGETLEENLVREAEEETGLRVEPVHRLYEIRTKTREKYNCQLYIFSYVCKIVGGKLAPSDSEVLESKWYDPDEITNLKLFPDDGDFIVEILPELKEVIKNYSL